MVMVGEQQRGGTTISVIDTAISGPTRFALEANHALQEVMVIGTRSAGKCAPPVLEAYLGQA
jgi:hypothetical protein